MINYIKYHVSQAAASLVVASEGNPMVVGVSLMILSIFYSLLASTIDTIVWGERFVHLIDAVVVIVSVMFYGYCIILCARYQRKHR